MPTPLPDPVPFLDRLFAALKSDGPNVQELPLDHLCYRVATDDRYTALRKELMAAGTLLAETMVGGRPIATFRLNAPLRYQERDIDLVELPAPKPGSPYAEGWEHAEFVVDEDLLAFTQRHPHLPWDLSDLHRPLNADVRLRLGAFSAKFHRMSLDAVIRLESDLRG